MSPAKESDNLYLDNLEEFLYDENKIVTYKWLSRTLKVHVNQAKQMLATFLRREEGKKRNDLTVTYQLTGFATKDSGDKLLKVCVVGGDQLAAVKAVLSPLLSCHVYSLQRVVITNGGLLYGADVDVMKENILTANAFNGVRCDEARARSEREMAEHRLPEAHIHTGPVKAKGQSEDQTKQPKENRQPQDKPAKTQDKTAKTQDKTAKTQDKAAKPKATQKGIAGMFAQAPKQKQASEKDKDKKEEAASSAAKPASKAAGFFGKVTVKKPAPEKVEVKKEETAREPAAAAKTRQPAKRQEKKTKKDDKSSKRRRVIMESSSEEESDVEIEQRYPSPSPPPPTVLAEDSEEEDPLPQKAEVKEEEVKVKEEKAVESPDLAGGRRRKRRRRLVNKTYADDEGFMVTEKVYEDQSTDASEAEDPAKPQPAKAPQASPPSKKAKTSPKKPGKQTNIMNFFGKR